ncbi:hypothetical protein BJ878DRAFT_483257 [Calycina marina]|uniref:Uncharacterized protein n=1 Tax=Calycina marina TaxID=1763456 RepID=A0A9P7YW54_9HELO|nr:hypothetical protein BJ878DRAFT_483257 [Calycina marina]
MVSKEITLTQKETELLSAIVGLMCDVPDIDYNVLAERVGVKYARNVRTSAKKLFDKIKETAPSAPSDEGSSTGEGEVKEPAAKRAKTSKTATKTATAKKTGTPKKPPAKRNAGPKKCGKRTAPLGDEVAAAEEAELEEETCDVEGKLLPTRFPRFVNGNWIF